MQQLPLQNVLPSPQMAAPQAARLVQATTSARLVRHSKAERRS
jgi:hypothetical protein